jgi:hypothetical protein
LLSLMGSSGVPRVSGPGPDLPKVQELYRCTQRVSDRSTQEAPTEMLARPARLCGLKVRRCDVRRRAVGLCHQVRFLRWFGRCRAAGAGRAVRGRRMPQEHGTFHRKYAVTARRKDRPAGR